MRCVNFIRKYCLDVFTLKTAIQILMVVLLAGGTLLYASYYFSRRNIERGALESSRTRLQEIVNLVDTNISYAEGIATSLAVSREAKYLSAIPYLSDQEKILHVLSMVNQLQLYKYSNSLIHSVYLYYPNSDSVIYDALYRSRSVDDLQYLAADTGGGLVALTPSSRFSHYTDAEYQDLLKITKRIGTDPAGGYAVVNLDAARLSELLDGMMLTGEEHLYVADAAGGLVLRDKAPPAGLEPGLVSWEGEKYVVTYLESPLTRWRFRLAIPFAYFYQNSSSLQSLIPVISVAVFLISGLLTFWITLRISKPVNRLYYSVAGNREPQRDHLQYLLDSYEELQEKNNRLALERELTSLLLYAGEERGTCSGKLRTLFHRRSFLVLVIDLAAPAGPSGEMELLKALLCRQLVQAAFREKPGDIVVETVQIDPRRLAGLLNFEADDRSEEVFFSLLSDLIVTLHEELSTGVNIGVSRQKAALREVHTAYQEALQALEYQFITGSNELIYFDAIPVPALPSVSYPADLERELLKNIKMGDSGQTEQTLQKLRGLTGGMKQTQPAFYQLIAASMMNAVRQVAFQLMPQKQAEEICNRPQDDAERDLIRPIERICGEVLGYMEELKNHKNAKIAQEILAYLDGHYAESLTVESVSALFRISTSYCYRILREQKQTSPMSHLAMVRVEKSKELLLDTQYPVKAISDQCGFESLQIFYRQFKNIVGISPSEYRRTGGRL